MSENKCELTYTHANAFQYGYNVYCHDCKSIVATSYVCRFYKKPYWLSEKEITENDVIAQND